MGDENWFWLIAILIAVFVLWRKGPSAAPPNNQPPEIVIPRVPTPEEERGRPTGQAKPPRLPPSVPPSPPQLDAPALTVPRRGKKRWLIGPERIAWQKEQRDKQEREREEDRQSRRDEAKRMAEEKRAREEEERRRSLQEAERRNLEEEERRRRIGSREAQDSAVGREFAHYIARPVPQDIKHAMREFLAGQFVGADRSPLAYVGYHVGVTNGLPVRDRERRIEVCFQIDIPAELRANYASWGGPGSQQRLNAMSAHLSMLAAKRRDRPNFEVAVAEWERDAAWLKDNLGALAEKFTRHGVTW